MKHLTTIAAILAAILLAIAAILLVSDRTALIAAPGLRKVAAAAGAATILALIGRWILGIAERQDARRWTVRAHPATWLLAPLALAGAAGLLIMTGSRAMRPSWHGNWSIGIYLSAAGTPADFSPLGPQPVITAADVTDIPCGFVADPVLVHDGDSWQLFFEAWNLRTGHGDICLATSSDGQTWSYRGRVLDEPRSLSYPTVFAYDGTWYMIPESRKLDELRLYRATAFPTDWVLDRVLLDGAAYRDTNILEHEGHWYLFTVADYGLSLLVFVADSPLGPWRPHPGNPVEQDDGSLVRGGGSIVRVDGLPRRFTQDILPYYGNRVRAAVIETLTPTDYRQRPLGPEPVLVGHDDWNSMGMHTLWCVQRDDGRWLAAVDGHGKLIDTKAMVVP